MNEHGSKRREWVKTAAIIFLSVLLVLTFFSNTIMKYSLAEVAAQYAESGTITAKIRGGGVVESGDPYNVMVKQTRKVMSVAVKEGEQVQKGDVLLYLEDEESEELKAAQEQLKAAQDAYDLALLSADVSAGAVTGSHSNTSTANYRQQITNAQAAVKQAKADVDALQEDYDTIAAKIELKSARDADLEDEKEALEDAKEVLDNAKFALQEAENQLQAVNDKLEYEISVSGNDIDDLTDEKNEATKKVNDAKVAVANAQLVYDKANTALENKKAEEDTSDEVADLSHELSKIKVKLDATKKELAEKEEALAELTADINDSLNLGNLYEKVADAQKEVDKELEKAQDAVVVADISGTVTSINLVAGEETSAMEPVAVLQPEGRGYTMSFSVTNEQAQRLAVGDRAELVNAWYYSDVNVTLSAIKPDKTDPGKKKLLTFDVSGEVTPGQTLNVSVGQKSASYDCIVPNSAIREDNNGKFVLVVESKSSPLGNRYIATRADVQVLASDDTRSAITGGVENWAFVITTSNKPIEAGQQVRLSDN
ncbi:MAG: HlyD family efflux transporter periplasmic adaptor subunit [Lachnospiraceae bacterium]|nr:HlyD family efflux transporter periplasmic adaptor subunit [Lachnospiraceae bacterium]